MYAVLCYMLCYTILCITLCYTMLSLSLRCLSSNSMEPSLGALLGLRCPEFGIISEVERRLRTGSV